MVNLTTADISDGADAQTVLEAIHTHWLWIRHLFADNADDKRHCSTRSNS